MEEPGLCDHEGCGKGYELGTCPKCQGPTRPLTWNDFLEEPEPPAPAPWALQYLEIEAGLGTDGAGRVLETEVQALLEHHGVDPSDRWIVRRFLGICQRARGAARFDQEAIRSRQLAKTRSDRGRDS